MGPHVNHYQRRAKNKAQEDRRKGAKQGAAIVKYLRESQAKKSEMVERTEKTQDRPGEGA